LRNLNALFIPKAIYPFARGPYMAAQAMYGKMGRPDVIWVGDTRAWHRQSRTPTRCFFGRLMVQFSPNARIRAMWQFVARLTFSSKFTPLDITEPGSQVADVKLGIVEQRRIMLDG
jgi:hypothetical protein